MFICVFILFRIKHHVHQGLPGFILMLLLSGRFPEISQAVKQENHSFTEGITNF